MVIADKYNAVKYPLRAKPLMQLGGTVSFFFSKVWLSVIKIERDFTWPYLDLAGLKTNRKSILKTSMRWRCSPHLLLKHIFQLASRKWLIVLGLPNKHWMLSRVAQVRILGSGTPVFPGAGRVTWIGEAIRVWDGRESWTCAQCTPSGPEQSIVAFRGFSPLLPGPTLCVCVCA